MLCANYLGDFTDDRKALMITPSGGVLVHTPKYDTNANYAYRNAKIMCGENGTLKVEMTNRYSGLQAEKLNQVMRYDKPAEVQQYENTKFKMPSYNVDKYHFKQVPEDPYMAVEEHASITANSMYNQRGGRYFINMNVAPLKPDYSTISGERKTPFILYNSEAVRDTFELEIPANKTIEFIPEPVCISHLFGYYTCTVTKQEGKLLMVRQYVQHSGVYNKAMYHDYEKFMATVNSGNTINIVLTQN
jgi:hypothetical protein